MKSKPLIMFKVWVDPRDRKRLPFYFWCSIWKNVVQARNRMRELDANPKDNRAIDTAAGACYSWTVKSYRPGKDGDLKPDIGEIVLSESWAGSSTICHECAHAAFRLGELIEGEKLEDEYTVEERHCLTVGYMTRAIVKRLIALRERNKVE
jgi:hypothetical protein